MKITTEVWIELGFLCECDYDLGRPAWGGSRFEPPINPPEPATVELENVTRVAIQKARWHKGKPFVTTTYLELTHEQNKALSEILSNFDPARDLVGEAVHEAVTANQPDYGDE